MVLEGVQVPPGLDHAGYWQASYLNLDFTLRGPPKGDLQVGLPTLLFTFVLIAAVIRVGREARAAHGRPPPGWS
jgi:hypothetical protein